MNRREFTQKLMFTAGVLGTSPLARLAAQQQTGTGNAPAPRGAANDNGARAIAKGVVSGVREGRKFPLPQVRVSNGREVVTTDRLGRYSLPVEDGGIIFITKPRGYALPVNAQNLPQFHYIHMPAGSPPEVQAYKGIAPTGPLPASIDFTLQAQHEPDEFRVLLFGDPQPRDQKEVGYVIRDVVNDVAGEKAAFGVSLGDLAHDDLSLFENQNNAIALLGMPWFNMAGNHDANFDAPSLTNMKDTYKRVFGPAYYSFDYGPVHFVVVDNVAFHKDAKAKRYRLHTEMGEKQLAWLANDLKFVSKDQLVVFMMHIPPVNLRGNPDNTMRDVKEFFRVIQDHPHTFSISAHTHIQEHAFLDRKDGWNGAGKHHHLNHATVCGNWWKGVPDEQGIPHTTMSDGTPNGYSFLNFKGNTYTVDFRAARRPASYQMNIFAPLEVAQAELGKSEVLANVFAGSERSMVEVQVGDGAWVRMQRSRRRDPGYVACKAMEELLPDTAFNKLPGFNTSSHIWVASLPTTLPVGSHLVRVRTTDMWGRAYDDSRVIRVV